MAIKTYVTSSSTATIADNDVTIVGGTAGTEKIKILTGVTGVTADANIEKFDLAGSLADYKFVFVAGTGVQIQTAAGVVVTTIPSLNQAATLAFADGSAALTQTGSSAFALGSAAIPTTAAVLTTAAVATFDTTVKSTVNPNVAAGVGQVFTLSTGDDAKTLTTGNDTINGSTNSLSSNDLIIDPSNTDADIANLLFDAAATPTITNVETVNIDFALGTASTALNTSKITGANVISLDTSAAGQTSARLEGVRSGTVFTVDNSLSGTVDISTKDASTSSEAVTLKLSGTASTFILANNTTTNDIDLLTINSISSANSVTLGSGANFISSTGDTESITVTGDQSLTIISDQTTDATKLDGATVVNSLTGSATLVVKIDGTSTTIEAGAVDLTKVAASSFNIADATHANTNIQLASGATVVFSENIAGNGTKITGTATNSTLNLSATKDQTTGSTLNLNNYSLVNLSVAADRVFGPITFDQATSLNDAKLVITGAGNVTVGSAGAGAITAKVIDASAATGKQIYTIGTTSTVTTGSAIDTIVTGNNIVTLNTQGGNDIITIGTAKQIVNSGAGDDLINFGGDTALDGGDIIDGGDANDTVKFTGGDNALNLTDNTFTLTNIEALDFSQITTITNAVSFIGSQLSGKTLNLVGSGALVAVGVDTAGTAQSIDLSGISHTGFTSVTLTGSDAATGDILKGTKSGDIIDAGTGADTIYGGLGTDIFVINLGDSTAATTGTVVATAAAGTFALGSGDFTTLDGSSASKTLDVSLYDVIADWGTGAGDKLRALTNAGTPATPVAGVDGTITDGVADNKIAFVRGTYSSAAKTFVYAANGSDTLAVYDAINAVTATTANAYEVIVLVGGGGHINTTVSTNDFLYAA